MGTPNLAFQGGSLSDGVEVVWRGVTHHWTVADISAIPGNLKKKEDTLNEWAQEALTEQYLLSEYDPDHRYRQDPPVLRDYERIEGAYVYVIQGYINCHIVTLGPPVEIMLRCSKEPIPADWWV